MSFLGEVLPGDSSQPWALQSARPSPALAGPDQPKGDGTAELRHQVFAVTSRSGKENDAR